MGRKKSRFYDRPGRKSDDVDTNAVHLEDIHRQAASLSNSSFGKSLKAPTKREREFEKYMTKKMKKEARPLLFERLQALNPGVGRELLQSTKQLVVHDSRKDAKIARKAVDRKSVEEEVVENVANECPVTGNTIERFISDYSSDEEKEMTKCKELLVEGQMQKEAVKISKDTNVSAKTIEKNPSRDSLSIPSVPAYFVLVDRDPGIQAQRELLPIYREEQVIMETIQNNPVTLLCGETGSGKTTQVPQFLWEAGYGDPAGPNPGIIGITQPRRVAAISMAHRVSMELGGEARVAHQVRFDAVSLRPDTRIKFMTEGILLAEIANDFILRRYSCIILDEAHERTINTDLLIGMLSRIVKLRASKDEHLGVPPLKLVIMSATLNIEQLAANQRLFDPPPPIINVPARQHPVQVHFAQRTSAEGEYLQDAVKTVRRIHSKMPPGGILVFLTGKQEIWHAKRMLDNRSAEEDSFEGSEESENEDFNEIDAETQVEDLDEEALFDKKEFAEIDESLGKMSLPQQLYILPLYAALPSHQQMRVFDETAIPPNSRLCVLATNVAETSLTIPGIRYVVDGGRVKERQWCRNTHATRYIVSWTSQASANQRAGRAGRTGPGHCYRLYSSALFDRVMPAHGVPEIERSPMESFILLAKSMGIDRVERFPLPTCPPLEAFKAGESFLVRLGAIDGETGKITSVGRLMAQYPVAPCWAKMVTSLGSNSSLVVALVAVLSVGDPFEEFSPDGSIENRRAAFVQETPAISDLLVWLNALLAYSAKGPSERAEFCQEKGLVLKRLNETLQLYQQLCRISAKLGGAKIEDSLPLKVPREMVEK